MPFARLILVVVLTSIAFLAHSAPYRVGGATGPIASDSGNWAWDGSYMASFRAALENPLNFGPTGTVSRSIVTTNLATVDAGSLAGVDMFIGTWVSDAQAAPMTASVSNFFYNGGDLFLLQDDSGHDEIGSSLGMSTTGSDGSVSNGGSPLFDGPFGIATDVKQFYAVGQLDGAAITAHNGHIGGTNASGQITSAYWSAGEYALGAGALFIIADVDMISTTTGCGDPLGCGASYSPLNDNGIYALNTFSFLQSNGGTPPVPEPETYAMLLVGFRANWIYCKAQKGCKIVLTANCFAKRHPLGCLFCCVTLKHHTILHQPRK